MSKRCLQAWNSTRKLDRAVSGASLVTRRPHSHPALLKEPPPKTPVSHRTWIAAQSSTAWRLTDRFRECPTLALSLAENPVKPRHASSPPPCSPLPTSLRSHRSSRLPIAPELLVLMRPLMLKSSFPAASAGPAWHYPCSRWTGFARGTCDKMNRKIVNATILAVIHRQNANTLGGKRTVSSWCRWGHAAPRRPRTRPL